VNGHELAVSPDRRLAYVPIYGNSGVGKPGTDGHSIDIVELQKHTLAGHIDLGKAVRPHCAKFGPGGYLYVSAELASAVYIVDVHARKVIGEIPTGAIEAHMFVLSPDGHRLYTANVGAGSVSVLDVDNRKLLKVIPVSRQVQRISISPDGRHVYTIRILRASRSSMPQQMTCATGSSSPPACTPPPSLPTDTHWSPTPLPVNYSCGICKPENSQTRLTSHRPTAKSRSTPAIPGLTSAARPLETSRS